MQGYGDFYQMIVLFGLLGFVLLWFAHKQGFFSLPPGRERPHNPVFLKTVLATFGIYLGMTMAVAPMVVALYRTFSGNNPPSAFLGWLQLLMLVMIFLLFYLYSRAQNPRMFGWIWKDRTIPHPKPVGIDFLIGVLTWIISFPLVVVIGQIADMILYFFFHFEGYEQVAVRYLKTTLESPPMLAVAIFTILLAAPVIEEFLFRGCLQNYFKRYMPTRQAIALSALCFSLFHLSPSQGIGNISLVATLFCFALFLGFIYERQASLFASIGLHMTFNAVSTFRILFFPE